MYMSIHEYAAEKCRAGGADAERDVEARHGRHFAGFGSEEALDALVRQGGVRWRRALALELDNLVAACRRAVARRDAEVAVAAFRATWEMLELQGPFALGVALGAQAPALDGIPASLRAAAGMAQARATWRAGSMDDAQAGLALALARSRELGDRRCESVVLYTQGNLLHEQSRVAEARAWRRWPSTAKWASAASRAAPMAAWRTP